MLHTPGTAPLVLAQACLDARPLQAGQLPCAHAMLASLARAFWDVRHLSCGTRQAQLQHNTLLLYCPVAQSQE